MVNIAIFWTWYRNRTTVSAKRKVTEMRRSNKTWLVKWTLPISIAHRLVATVAGYVQKRVLLRLLSFVEIERLARWHSAQT